MPKRLLVRIGVAVRVHVADDWKVIGDGSLWATSFCGWGGAAVKVEDTPGRALPLCSRCLQLLTEKGK